MEQERLLPLRDSRDVLLVGGKAKALGQLLQDGFRVPDGFVVTTEVKVINDKFKIEILDKFDRLDSKYVAVRSSAIAEDGKKDAWAGQLDTFLNVKRIDLIEKIRLCQESASSERAKSYAHQKGLKADGVAVIVQEMVQSEVSGIAFSANPVTKNGEQVVVEAGFGLNEPIVSGEITPDTYIINKASGEIMQKHIVEQTKMLSQGKDGNNDWRDIKNGKDQKLSGSQIKELLEVVKKLEKFFGFPVDVEWTYANDELFILQSRSITTLS